MKISVIIPALNSARSLQLGMESVWSQTHKDYELIVMDGGSKDGTKELLERQSDKITYWQSAKDKGTTDAMNSGFKKATGDLVTFLCSDDRFYNEEVFARVAREFAQYPETDVLCAGLEVVDPTGDVRTFRSFSRPDLLYRGMTVHLPGAFFRRSVLAERSFAEGAEVANDYELFAFLQKSKGVNIRVMNEVTVTFSLGGRTNDPATDFWKAHECFAVRRKYYGVWTAYSHYALELGIAVLRKMGIRPFTWGRRVRRRFEVFAGFL